MNRSIKNTICFRYLLKPFFSFTTLFSILHSSKLFASAPFLKDNTKGRFVFYLTKITNRSRKIISILFYHFPQLCAIFFLAIRLFPHAFCSFLAHLRGCFQKFLYKLPIYPVLYQKLSENFNNESAYF